jgi:hypothetical protein
MGSSNVDYKQQIDQGLAQSNLPKAPLAQEYSNLFGNASPGLMNALMNVQNLGNSFVNSNNASFKPYSPGQANPTGMFGLGPTGQGQGTVNDAYNWLFNTVGNHKANASPANPNQGFSSTNSVNRPNVPQASPLPDGYTMGSGADYGAGYYNGSKIQGKTTDQNGDPAWQLASGELIPWSQATSDAIDQNATANYYKQFPSSPSNPTYSSSGQVNRPSTGSSSNPNDPYGLFAGFSNFFGPNAGIDPNTGAPSGFNKSSFGPNSNLPFDWSSATPMLLNPRPGTQLPRDPNNPTQPYQPGTYPTTPISSSGSSANLANGLPNGISIPDLITAFQGDTGGAINGLGNAANSTASMLQQILGMNPGSLQSIGQNGGANLGLSNPNQQIQQLLSMVGNNYQNVATPNVNNPNFSQQLLQPQSVNSNFNPQMAQPGNVNANFNPTQANLSGVPNSTQLSPQNSSAFDAISQMLNQQNAKNIGDIRERDLQTGTARSTGAGYDEATYRAQALPQLASSLENVRNQEVGNQLNQAQLQQQGLLSNADMANQYGLGGAQLGANTSLANVQNYLNSVNQNNQAGLGASTLNSNVQLQNIQNMLNAGN